MISASTTPAPSISARRERSSGFAAKLKSLVRRRSASPDSGYTSSARSSFGSLIPFSFVPKLDADSCVQIDSLPSYARPTPKTHACRKAANQLAATTLNAQMMR